ncbi:MAG: hypothetical protein JWO91_75 [Acidobacteriaceae bacterium]|nr:hypothetical protein [Acidobacteriaceae bacterium]
MRIEFASQNRLDDGLARYSADIAQHIGQLDIHLGQSFLYPLNMSARSSHQVVALSPMGPYRADLLDGPERISQESIRVQLHQPLTLLHIGFASRQTIRLSGIDQVHFETSLFQDVEDRDPVDTRRLHRDSRNPALL